MRQVRQIQAMFYGGNGGTSSDVVISPDPNSNYLLVDNYDGSTHDDDGMWAVPTEGDFLRSLPLFRTSSTELPGGQIVIEIDEAEYSHMFRQVFTKPQPIQPGVKQPLMFFGNLYVPEEVSKPNDDPSYMLLGGDSSQNKAKRIGTIMQVSDVKEDRHGKITILAQSLNIRFEVVDEATQHSPFAMATVKLLQDVEQQEATATKSQNTPSPIWDEHIKWFDWEVRPTYWKDQDEHGTVGVVSSLMNYNSNFYPTEKDTTIMMTLPTSSSSTDNIDSSFFMTYQELEYHAWVALDALVTTSLRVNPRADLTIPPQLLSLLPTAANGRTWPAHFSLDQLSPKHFKTPGGTPEATSPLDGGGLMGDTVRYYPRFVRVAPSSTTSDYPDVRRASRFSFAVWTFLEKYLHDVIDVTAEEKQKVLEMKSVKERLHYVYEQMEHANLYLRQSLSATGTNSSSFFGYNSSAFE